MTCYLEPPEASITEKRRNKAIWCEILLKLKFLKNTSKPNHVKSLGYIKCYTWVAPYLFKALAILSDTTVRISADLYLPNIKFYERSL